MHLSTHYQMEKSTNCKYSRGSIHNHDVDFSISSKKKIPKIM